MAKRRPITKEMPEAVREAVERTVQATIGSAQLTRGRAQDAVDEIVRTAGSSAGAVRERVIEVFEDRRPVTNEDLGEIRAELRKISRRLGAIERRLDEGGAEGARGGPGRAASGGAGGGSRGGQSSRGGSRSGAAKSSRGAGDTSRSGAAKSSRGAGGNSP